jgi:aminodeoxyfutalosine synthase
MEPAIRLRTPHSADPARVLALIRDTRLARVAEQWLAGNRLNQEDGLACLQTTDLLGLGSLAFLDRTARYGSEASFIANYHINYTNICGNKCRFCAFYRDAGASDAYLLTPEQVADRVRNCPVQGLREVHLVGGCHPALDFDYYRALVRAIKGVSRDIRLKAFTAVEIEHMARKEGISVPEALTALKQDGLDALPGGGAEVFAPRVREALCPPKISGDSWLAVHGHAHGMGIGSNATLLFGHIETPEERVDHLLRLREQQDKTHGFRAFIPLVFHSPNTSLRHLGRSDGVDILKTVATSRLMLDNIPHIKAYWVMLGPKLAATALWFGADDLEGTLVDEKITHEAGGTTAAGMSRTELEDLIRDAGFVPVERDTFHGVVA